MDYQEVLRFLAPFLPYLVAGGKEVARGAAKKLGEAFSEDAWERAKGVWSKLHPKVEANPAGKQALLDLVKAPEDPDTLAALRWQIGRVLSENPQLASELMAIVRPARVVGVATADRVATTGELSGISAKQIRSGAEVIGRAEAGEVEGKESGVSVDTIGGSGAS
jgi:hypothetical protein